MTSLGIWVAVPWNLTGVVEVAHGAYCKRNSQDPSTFREGESARVESTLERCKYQMIKTKLVVVVVMTFKGGLEVRLDPSVL